MRPRVYIETTVPSYLTAWPSRDLVQAAYQHITREWWSLHRPSFDLVVSQLVLDECADGDPTAAADRLAALAGLPLIAATAAAGELATELLSAVPLPPKAAADALHVATAAVHGVEYLLTWNCKHLANAVLRPKVESVCGSRGYRPPSICTPAELLPQEVPDGAG